MNKKKKGYSILSFKKKEQSQVELGEVDDAKSDSSEEDMGDIERTFLERLMIDSEVTVFLKDV